MSYALGSRSLGRLEGVHPDLVRVVKRAIEITAQDFMVTEGLRTLARQKDLYAQGRTKPGPVVTWTLKSKHIDGLAVDLVPFNDGKPDWTAGKNFDEIAKAMHDAAEELGPGDYICYPADLPHIFKALEPDTHALLVAEQN